MLTVLDPSEMTAAFARAFNNRNLEDLAGLYELGAKILVNADSWTGLEEIRACLTDLMNMPGVMSTTVNFCVVNGDLAVLRADYAVRDGETLITSGSSIELARRQADGSWRYVIDHATGASQPSLRV